MLKFEAKKGDFAKIWQKLGGLQPPGSAAHVYVVTFKNLANYPAMIKAVFKSRQSF